MCPTESIALLSLLKPNQQDRWRAIHSLKAGGNSVRGKGDLVSACLPENTHTISNFHSRVRKGGLGTPMQKALVSAQPLARSLARRSNRRVPKGIDAPCKASEHAPGWPSLPSKRQTNREWDYVCKLRPLSTKRRYPQVRWADQKALLDAVNEPLLPSSCELATADREASLTSLRTNVRKAKTYIYIYIHMCIKRRSGYA